MRHFVITLALLSLPIPATAHEKNPKTGVVPSHG